MKKAGSNLKLGNPKQSQLAPMPKGDKRAQNVSDHMGDKGQMGKAQSMMLTGGSMKAPKKQSKYS